MSVEPASRQHSPWEPGGPGLCSPHGRPLPSLAGARTNQQVAWLDVRVREKLGDLPDSRKAIRSPYWKAGLGVSRIPSARAPPPGCPLRKLWSWL